MPRQLEIWDGIYVEQIKRAVREDLPEGLVSTEEELSKEPPHIIEFTANKNGKIESTREAVGGMMQ